MLRFTKNSCACACKYYFIIYIFLTWRIRFKNKINIT